MDNSSLVLNQIIALSQLLAERGIDFDIPPRSELEKCDRTQLEHYRRALHEIVYAPPPRK